MAVELCKVTAVGAPTGDRWPQAGACLLGGVMGIKQEPSQPSLTGRPASVQKVIRGLLRDKLFPNQVFSYLELWKHF